MKVEKIKKEFEPVVITIESGIELKNFYAILCSIKQGKDIVFADELLNELNK